MLLRGLPGYDNNNGTENNVRPRFGHVTCISVIHASFFPSEAICVHEVRFESLLALSCSFSMRSYHVVGRGFQAENSCSWTEVRPSPLRRCPRIAQSRLILERNVDRVAPCRRNKASVFVRTA